MKTSYLTKHLSITLIPATILGITGCRGDLKSNKALPKPNILILMSDNQSWNHLGCYGDLVVKTPNIDRIATQGIRFTNAYCSAPSSSPARASLLTGQDIWRLEEAANLHGSFPSKFKVYTKLLEETGYFVGHEGKGWGPGNYKAGGWEKNPAGGKFNSFKEFLTEKKKGQPFCYWFSSRHPHRPYIVNSYKDFGINPEEIVVPPYLPDTLAVKQDIGDYLAAVQSFDTEVGSNLQILKESGELKNTLIIICSDNGWQMPRGLANLYDFGTRVPLIVSFPSKYKGGRVVDDFLSLNDFAPTFLELAGIPIPAEMTARSFANILESELEGTVDTRRNFIVMARERHAYVRKNGAGYGSRALRTKELLYIRNYDYENWPAGDPPLYGDVDAHMLHYPCPTKIFILKNKERNEVKKFYDLGFGKRLAEELYDLKKDQYQLNNVAYSEDYKNEKNIMSEKLTSYLKANGDPRELGGIMKWLGAPYYLDEDKIGRPGDEARRELNLKKEYTY